MNELDELLNEIGIATSARQWDQAITLINKALATMPKDWSPLKEEDHAVIGAFWSREEFLAFCHAKMDALNKSIYWRGCSYSKLCWHLSMSFLESGRSNNAIVAVERGLLLEPDHPILWAQKALILNRTGEHEEALKAYQTAESIRPWAPTSYRARALRGQGAALIDLEKFEEAQKCFESALELEPENQLAREELEYINRAITERKKEAEKMLWFLKPYTHPATDPLTVQLLAVVEGLPSVPGPKTVGSENYTHISHAYFEEGWPGFERAFDEVIPRARPDYADIKRELLRESIFNPQVHSRMARSVLGITSIDEILDEINKPPEERKAN